MIITSFDIYKYNIALARPLSICGQELSCREGLILHLKSDEGEEGFGEVAPLVGLSRESLDEAIAQVNNLKKDLIQQSIADGLEKLDGKFATWFKDYELSASVRCGIEMAILQLIANTRKITLARLLTETPREQIHVNGLVQGDRTTVLEQARQLLADGFKEMKLKVGRGSLEEDAQTVKEVSELIRDRSLLHIDANQAWSFDQAVTFGEIIGCTAVTYIEEPFKDFSKIPDFFSRTYIPTAFDETLYTGKRCIFPDGVDVLVLKPTLLGGIEKTWQIMSYAQKMALRVVISSSFESAVGVLTWANLAACLKHDSPAGLDTLKWLKKDLFNENLIIEQGQINIAEHHITSDDIDFGAMTKI